MHTHLNIPCIQIPQGKRRLLVFGLDGKQVPLIAQVSRLARGSENEIAGYQRPEIMSHISEIRKYLESDNPLLPNGIVVAFDTRVKFIASHGQPQRKNSCIPGEISIPIPKEGSPRPGWIVDGQQRAAALRDAEMGAFAVVIIGFVTDEIEDQREQFILVNSTKPLPKGLIYELLPGTKAELPSQLERKRYPAYLLERMNFDSRSPLHHAIKTPTSPGGFIQDNSILRMLGNSLNDGALNRIAIGNSSDHTHEILECLFEFWAAVIKTFPNDWNLPPRMSRLTHGVGIISLGYMMDAIFDKHRHSKRPWSVIFLNELKSIADACHWRSGVWQFTPSTQRKWSDLQNTSKDIQLVANFLLTHYRSGR